MTIQTSVDIFFTPLVIIPHHEFGGKARQRIGHGPSLNILQCGCCFQGPLLNECIMYAVITDCCNYSRMTLFEILYKIDGTLSENALMEKIFPLN